MRLCEAAAGSGCWQPAAGWLGPLLGWELPPWLGWELGTATSAKINKLYHRPGQPSQIIMSEFARLNVTNEFKKSATGIIWSRKKDSEQREGRRSFEEFSKLHCWAADRAG